MLVFGLATVTLSVQLQAQDGGDGGAIDGGDFGDTDFGGGTGVGGGDVEGIEFAGIDQDNRNQGFVGATAPEVSENTFVGAASQTFGALADGATFGGGVNDNNDSNVPGGGGVGGGGIGGNGGAGGFNGTGGTGSVFRSNLRTRLRPAFSAPVIPAQVIESNFNNNLSRQPTAQSLVGRYQVTIENKTATVTGFVNNQADADRLIRQLKLQPGVYGIISRLQIGQ